VLITNNHLAVNRGHHPISTMAKPERIGWKDSNLALIGSDLDHKVKAASAAGEHSWDGLGQKALIKIWRIEQFNVVAWPDKKMGKLHSGDSYIVLNSYKEEGSNALLHDIHIWIGNDSSQDEYGTAAYKMVELDEFLGGSPVQHREVQGKESPVSNLKLTGIRIFYCFRPSDLLLSDVAVLAFPVVFRSLDVLGWRCRHWLQACRGEQG
jgi:hypothetical protein